MKPLTELRDILVQPPTQPADAAFFFKEAHRFEQRQKGSTRIFLQSLPARLVLLSLPTANLGGTHPKLDQHRKLVYTAIQGFPWNVKELLFENEIVFCIRKST
jgi:16S rRNA (guanine(1405)-N(7))-methyltransferase